MKDHTDLLNLIAKKINAQSYLEIGVFNPDHNFNKIGVKEKTSVDPDPKACAMFEKTSDQFFSDNPDWKFDLIFIDGLHHADQVKKDVENAWKSLNLGGVIVLHDCNPHSEKITHVPRDNREWCGDVYKIAASILCSNKFTVDFDYGCTVIRKESGAFFAVFEAWKYLDWETFNESRKGVLSLKSVEDTLSIIDSWT